MSAIIPCDHSRKIKLYNYKSIAWQNFNCTFVRTMDLRDRIQTMHSVMPQWSDSVMCFLFFWRQIRHIKIAIEQKNCQESDTAFTLTLSTSYKTASIRMNINGEDRFSWNIETIKWLSFLQLKSYEKCIILLRMRR